MMATDEITVSYSELDAYRQCPLKWALGYRDLWTRDAAEGSALHRGSSWHEVMQAHYGVLMARGGKRATGLSKVTSKAEREILDECMAAVFPLLHDGQGVQSEQQELIAWMYAGHVAQYGIDREWRVIGVEQAGRTPLLDQDGQPTRFMLKYKVDLAVIDLATQQLKVVDHKSASNFSREVEIDIDDQFGLYTWAWWQQHKRRPLAIVRSDARTQRNKGEMTLEQRFKRQQTFRSDKELNNIALDALRTAITAYNGGALVHSSPAPDRCAWRCDFLAPHLAMRKGLGKPETILTDFGFYQREHKHREYTTEEGQA